MKTLITANGSTMRVSDEDAWKMVNGIGRYSKGDYEYCPKSEYKKERDAEIEASKNKKK